MFIPICRAVQAVASLAALVTALGGCARVIEGHALYATGTPPSAATQLVKIADLPNLLPTVAESGAVVKSAQLTKTATYTGLGILPEGFTLSDPNCVGVMNGGLESTYRGSRYQGAAGFGARDEQGHLVEVTAVAFAGGAEADKFVGAQIRKWKDCTDATLTAKSGDEPPVSWTVNGVNRSYGVAVLVRVQEGGQGYGCARGMAARANIVADLSVCNPDQTLVERQASKLVNMTLAKIGE
jgi:hypothetical protein